MTDDSGEPSRVSRRGYLGLLGSATILAVGATQVTSADEEGYGTSGYGSAPYGGDGETVTALDVQTLETSHIHDNGATLLGELSELQGYESATVYFEWGTSNAELSNSTSERTLQTTGEFEATLSDLDADTEYEFRAVATADGQVVTGETTQFRTDQTELDEAVPTIEELTGADVSNPRNPHVNAEIHWEATIDESELYAAILTLSDADGELETWTYDLSGQTASATETRRIPHAADSENSEYDVDLVVYSYYGNTDTQAITFNSQ